MSLFRNLVLMFRLATQVPDPEPDPNSPKPAQKERWGHSHDWDNWTVTKRWFDDGCLVYTEPTMFIYQERTCKTCGYVEVVRDEA